MCILCAYMPKIYVSKEVHPWAPAGIVLGERAPKRPSIRTKKGPHIENGGGGDERLLLPPPAGVHDCVQGHRFMFKHGER